MAKRLKFYKLIKLSANSLLPFSVVTSALVPLLACNNPNEAQSLLQDDAILKYAKAVISGTNSRKFQLYKELKVDPLSDPETINSSIDDKSFFELNPDLRTNLTDILQNLVSPQNDSITSKWSYPKVDLKIEAINGEKFREKFSNFKGAVKVVLTYNGKKEVIEKLDININNDKLDDTEKLNAYIAAIKNQLFTDSENYIPILPQHNSKILNSEACQIIFDYIKKRVQKIVPVDDLDVIISPIEQINSIYEFKGIENNEATGEIVNLTLTFNIKGSDDTNHLSQNKDNKLELTGNDGKKLKVKQKSHDFQNQITNMTNLLTNNFFAFKDFDLPYNNRSDSKTPPEYLFPNEDQTIDSLCQGSVIFDWSVFDKNNNTLDFNIENLQKHFKDKIENYLSNVYSKLKIEFDQSFEQSKFILTKNDDVKQGYFAFAFTIIDNQKNTNTSLFSGKKFNFNVYFEKDKNIKIKFPQLTMEKLGIKKDTNTNYYIDFDYIAEIAKKIIGEKNDSELKPKVIFEHVKRKIAEKLVENSYNKYSNMNYSDNYILKAIQDQEFSISFIDQTDKSLIDPATLLNEMNNKKITIIIVINSKNRFFEPTVQKYQGITIKNFQVT